MKPHTEKGIFSKKDEENAKLFTLGLAIGIIGCILGIVIELI